MASILPGFEYDIFVSYRHNDNLDGWVTDFVQNLDKELKATLKDIVSIYFDRSPHDGLLETHNVDKSLEGKLKCLIFIPIISQTYCDPKSFAWQHEFCAFNKLSKEDQFGRDIKLSNGNVASRILPIKIHDLDADDKATIEKEIDGVLRAIEFTFNSAGVSRPLMTADKREENTNKTLYRDQINKVARAIKELIVGVRNSNDLPIGESQKTIVPDPFRKRILRVAAVLVLLGILGFGFYNFGGLGESRTPATDRSIAVLPFVNMSNDPEQEYFSDGISEEVLNLLAKVPELKVIGRTSSFYFKGKNEDLRIIGEKLGAAHLLEGSVRKDGNKIRITAQLIRADDGSHLWSETYDRKLESVFELQDEIAADVLKQLKLKLLGISLTSPSAVSSEEVHNLMLKGKFNFNKGDYVKALIYYQQALALDSGNVAVWTSLAQMKAIMGNADFKLFDENFKAVRYCAEKALSLDRNFSDAHRAMGFAYYFIDFDWDKARTEFKTALQLDPNNSDAYRNLSQLETSLGNYDAAAADAQKSLELNPLNYVNLSTLGRVYLAKGMYDKAEKVFTEEMEFNPVLAKTELIYIYLISHRPTLAQKLIDEMAGILNEKEKIGMTAMIHYDLGKKSEAIQMLKKSMADIQLEKGSATVARAFAFMNQKDDAFEWLDKAFIERYSMSQLKWHPFFANLRGDPRFKELLNKMHLPKD